jgi:hypothetical protein
MTDTARPSCVPFVATARMIGCVGSIPAPVTALNSQTLATVAVILMLASVVAKAGVKIAPLSAIIVMMLVVFIPCSISFVIGFFLCFSVRVLSIYEQKRSHQRMPDSMNNFWFLWLFRLMIGLSCKGFFIETPLQGQLCLGSDREWESANYQKGKQRHRRYRLHSRLRR